MNIIRPTCCLPSYLEMKGLLQILVTVAGNYYHLLSESSQLNKVTEPKTDISTVRLGQA